MASPAGGGPSRTAAGDGASGGAAAEPPTADRPAPAPLGGRSTAGAAEAWPWLNYFDLMPKEARAVLQRLRDPRAPWAVVDRVFNVVGRDGAG